MADNFGDDIKLLQQLAESKGGASAMDWSTISHTHGGGAALAPQNHNLDPKKTGSSVHELQELAAPTGASTLEWSTISHTHGAT